MTGLTAIPEPAVTEHDLRSEPAELALLGAVALHADVLAGVLADLPGADFYRPARGIVWDACRDMSAANEPINPVSLARFLTGRDQWSNGVREVVQIEMIRHSDSSFTASYHPRHAEIIAELARRRQLVQVSNRLRKIAAEHPGDASEALAAMRSIIDVIGETERPRETDGPLGWYGLIDEFEEVHAPGGSRPGTPSPWWELDQLLGGLFGGRVYVFGGRPAQGKSTAALILAMHAATESGKQSLVISKEMPRVDVTGRILARGAEVPLSEINSRTLSEESKTRIREYAKRVGRPGLTVDAKPRSLAGIKALARQHHHRQGLDVLVVDYLQLVRTDAPGRSREQEVAEVSRQMKELALELDCVVVLPAQLNRESGKRSDPKPTMSDLRDSGQIEQDADAIILLHRPLLPDGSPTGQILFIVDKNRHGPTGQISLRWQGAYGAIG